jgi:hypothetical protein
MSLVDLWNSSPEQLSTKHVKQIIAFAGNGSLSDGGQGSAEFRGYLDLVPSEALKRYSSECLSEKFTDSGFALQDVVNQLGRRLGFVVENGRYRGSSKAVGFDGLWTFDTGHNVVVEVKTSDIFKIELDTIAGYRQALIRESRISADSSSILIVVGGQETKELEAQIRGSRHAWDIRLISVDSLNRLVNLKEDLDDPDTVRRIREILIPYEYTKVDRIIELVFATTEEALLDEISEQPDEEAVEAPASGAHSTPVKFNDACAARVEEALGQRFVKRSRTLYSSPNETMGLIAIVSKEHVTNGIPNYWYGFHEYQQESLKAFPKAHVAFGCGSPDTVLLIPFAELESWLPEMHVTQRDGTFYRHVQFFQEGNGLVLHRKKGAPRVDVTKYILKRSQS